MYTVPCHLEEGMLAQQTGMAELQKTHQTVKNQVFFEEYTGK